LLSRRGRTLPASASGVDTHRDSISSRFDCSPDDANPFELWDGGALDADASGDGDDQHKLLYPDSRKGAEPPPPPPLIALIMPITSTVKDCVTCTPRSELEPKKLLLFRVSAMAIC
jgi:hypothetical protein